MNRQTDNELKDWALMVPCAAAGALLAVGYGVGCMMLWAGKMAIKGVMSVRFKR